MPSLLVARSQFEAPRKVLIASDFFYSFRGVMGHEIRPTHRALHTRAIRPRDSRHARARSMSLVTDIPLLPGYDVRDPRVGAWRVRVAHLNSFFRSIIWFPSRNSGELQFIRVADIPHPLPNQVPARRIPQTLQYAQGGIQVVGLPDQTHSDRPVTATMADYDRIEKEHRPMTDKSIPLSATFKRQVSADPQNAPAPAPGAPAMKTLGEMNLGEGSAVPAWVAFDGMFLAFEAYFAEQAVDGNDRVRQVCLRYYLEDGTVDVTEPKTDNSGLAQGVLLRRHAVKPGQKAERQDFNVGGVVVLYGRTYFITKCDQVRVSRFPKSKHCFKPLREYT